MNSNIYDIDGELIYNINNPGSFTVEDAQERVKKYQEKLNKIDEKSHKAGVYKTYIANLQKFILNKYLANPDMLKQLFNATHDTDKEEIINALNDVNDDGITAESNTNEIPEQSPNDNEGDANEELGDDTPIERTDGNVYEDRPVSQSDLLVGEREEVNMDEYVDYTEA